MKQRTHKIVVSLPLFHTVPLCPTENENIQLKFIHDKLISFTKQIFVFVKLKMVNRTMRESGKRENRQPTKHQTKKSTSEVNTLMDIVRKEKKNMKKNLFEKSKLTKLFFFT